MPVSLAAGTAFAILSFSIHVAAPLPHVKISVVIGMSQPVLHCMCLSFLFIAELESIVHLCLSDYLDEEKEVSPG